MMGRVGIVVVLAGLALTACDGKETGPEESESESIPATATPVAAATPDPAAAKP